MHLNRNKKYLDKEKYTLFGQWYYFICSKLGVSDREVTTRAGINLSTINVNTRKSTPEPSTVQSVLTALHEIAAEKGVEWDALWDTQIYHGAGHATPQEVKLAAAVLEYFVSQEKEQ